MYMEQKHLHMEQNRPYMEQNHLYMEQNYPHMEQSHLHMEQSCVVCCSLNFLFFLNQGLKISF